MRKVRRGPGHEALRGYAPERYKIVDVDQKAPVTERLTPLKNGLLMGLGGAGNLYRIQRKVHTGRGQLPRLEVVKAGSVSDDSDDKPLDRTLKNVRVSARRTWKRYGRTAAKADDPAS
jgi:hypothetical protein